MKTARRIKNTLGPGLLVTLALALGSAAAVAQTPSQSAQSPNASSAPKRADSPSPVCAKCKTEAHEEFAVTKVGNEYVMRPTAVGTKHTCGACGGRITHVGGQTHNAMMDYCATCAKARPECCTIESHRNPAES